jgi:hypothetical protein
MQFQQKKKISFINITRKPNLMKKMIAPVLVFFTCVANAQYDPAVDEAHSIPVSSVVPKTTALFEVVNPVRGNISVVNKTGKAEELFFTVSNVAGKIFAKGKMKMELDATNKVQLPATLKPGVYVLLLKNETTRFRRRILVQQ